MVGKSRYCEICGVRERLRGGFFACFPKDEQRCKTWVRQVGKEDLVHIPIEKLHEVRHICGDHFAQRDFGNTGKRLKKRAYPKLHLSAPPLTETQLIPFPQHIASQQDAVHRLDQEEPTHTGTLNVSDAVHQLDQEEPTHTGTLNAPVAAKCHRLTDELPGPSRSSIVLEIQKRKQLYRNTAGKTPHEPRLKKGEVHCDHSYVSPDGNLPTTTTNADACDDLATSIIDEQSEHPEPQEDGPECEDDNQEGDSSLPKDEVMIDYIIEHPTSPGRDILETEMDKVFSWQKTDLLPLEADETDYEVVPVPVTEIPEELPTLSLFCDDTEKPVEVEPSKPEAVVPEDVLYRCVDCGVVVDGFTFWCVQCLCGVMCGACAEVAPHNIHYVLRAPKGATISQTQPVLLVIREQLQRENLLTLYGTDDGVKMEVKLEPVEPLCPSDSSDSEDPLALEPHSDEPEVEESRQVGESVEPSDSVQSTMELELESQDSQSDDVQFYDDVEQDTDDVLFQENAGSHEDEETIEASEPDVTAEKRANTGSLDHQHPSKRPRLQTRPSDKLNPTNTKVTDVHPNQTSQTRATQYHDITSQTVFKYPKIIPDAASQILQPIYHQPPPTKLVVLQKVKKGPNILRRPNKTDPKQVPNIADPHVKKSLPRGTPLQLTQTESSEFKVTSGPRSCETETSNSDDGNAEYLDEEILETDFSEDRLDKENYNEDRLNEELVVESEGSRIDRLLNKENRDDTSEKSDNDDSSKDKESEVDDSDLDKDFRIDEEVDEDSMDEIDSTEGVRITRNATRSQREAVRLLSNEAKVQLQRLTSLDIRNWTERKTRRKD
ncbi:uncharacterized protein LOC125237602 isoform X4 [Leguminivora glycinivorella]|uniref:uncharacterized protein LOC125237602 isoform X4 n=1 Tax=Leguminivora glycinivorella TaxID=1035111 RepID=UPI00200D87F3|nr:uncharacterized protein LOC125237602 isoform X4 [Leguminivora glycinivorella]